MPEQISKYPDITLQVLKDAGAICGQGAEQQILTECPAEQFCALPTGEICVYGIEQIPQMTQIKREELAQVVCSSAPVAKATPANTLELSGLSIIFMAGIITGGIWKHSKKKS